MAHKQLHRLVVRSVVNVKKDDSVLGTLQEPQEQSAVTVGLGPVSLRNGRFIEGVTSDATVSHFN